MIKRLTTTAAIQFLLLLVALTAHAQTAQNAVLVRNVRVADGSSGQLTLSNVLIAGGKISRVVDGALVPAGATVIDGGGCILTLGSDGQIILKRDGATATDQSRGLVSRSVAFNPAKPTRLEKYRGLPVEEKTATRTSIQTQQAAAQSGQQSTQQGEEDLASKVVDPTAALKIITFQTKYSPSLWGIDDEQNEGDIQLGIPFTAFGRPNILKVTIPYQTSSPSGSRGLTDVSVFDIALFPKEWGTLVLGAVASFGVNRGPDVDTFAIGPAVGTVFKKGRWTYGVFNQNLFSGDDIATTQIQPILGYTVNKKVSLALGDTQYTYDWKQERFVLLPLGIQVNYIAMLGPQPVRLLINPQYNFKNEFGSRKWTITAGIAFIVK